LSLVCVVQALAGIGVALRINWKLALVILSAIPAIAIGATIIGRHMPKHLRRKDEELTTATRIASSAIASIVTVKCFNTQEQETHRYVAAVREAAVFAIKEAFSNALQIGFVRFATAAMFVQGKSPLVSPERPLMSSTGFWFGGSLVHSGQTTSGEVVTTFWACLIATKALEGLLPHAVVIRKGQAAAVSLMTILSKVNKGKAQFRKVGGMSPRFCEGHIEMRQVRSADQRERQSLTCRRFPSPIQSHRKS
jgi:ATP-binding cassette, subfamily B (MDR/TAP), member 1